MVKTSLKTIINLKKVQSPLTNIVVYDLEIFLKLEQFLFVVVYTN